MREITDHKLPGLNEALTIQVTDEPGPGGDCHRYELTGFDLMTNPSTQGLRAYGDFESLIVLFQNGPIQESGVNGVSGEALLAIVIDRIRSFQSGKYACRENAIALTHCEEALMWLQKRTRDRLARGVEGTSKQ